MIAGNILWCAILLIMKKIFIGVGVVILLVLVGRAGWGYYQVVKERNATAQIPVGHDIAPIDDSDLRLQKVVVADSENAYFDLVKLKDVIYYPDDKKQIISDMMAGKIVWDEKLVQELISKNTEAFRYFVDASMKPEYQDPASADPMDISPNSILPPLNSFRSTANLSAVRAISLSNQSRHKEAMDEAFRSVNIGQKIQDSQGSLVGYLVGSSMKGTGLRATQKILGTSKLKTDELKRYSQELDKYYKNEEGLANAFKAEHYSRIWSLEILHKGILNRQAFSNDPIEKGSTDVSWIMQELMDPSPNFTNLEGRYEPSYYFQLNKSKLLEADLTRSQISDTNRTCASLQGFNVKKLDITFPAEIIKTENAIGIILRDVVAGSLGSIFTKKCQEDAIVGTTQIMFALKAFKNDTKKYPTTLDELVPKYLDVVPTDPFDGKPLKYSAEKKIIYSVGEDKKDDSGVMTDESKKAPDIVYFIGY